MYNQEIYKLSKEMELTRNIRLRRLQRVGQVMRMKDERCPRKHWKDTQKGEDQLEGPKEDGLTQWTGLLRGCWNAALEVSRRYAYACRQRTEDANAQVGL